MSNLDAYSREALLAKVQQQFGWSYWQESPGGAHIISSPGCRDQSCHPCGICYNSLMASFGRYGLVHPNADKVYAASRLWFLFGTESRFLAMLDELYERASPLLDIVTPGLHPVSSLEDLAAQWTRVAALVKQSEGSQVLAAQIKLLEDAVEGWGLRCD